MRNADDDPHSFEASLAVARAVSAAQLVVQAIWVTTLS
jgi:hypothetical protein